MCIRQLFVYRENDLYDELARRIMSDEFNNVIDDSTLD